MKPHLTLALCAALSLAACNSETKKQSGGTAGGEILPASVNDSMLPYDTVRSQAPLAPNAEGGAAGKDKKDAKPESRREPNTAREAAE